MSANSEWVLEIGTPNFEVADGDRRFAPEVVMLVDAASRYVFGCDLAAPDDAVAVAIALLRRTLAQHRPERVRVSSQPLRDALAAALDVAIVVGSTAEARAALRELTAHLARTAPAPPDSYLDGVAPDALVPFFAAAARLYRAQPWTAVPADDCLAVDCAALGVRDGRLAVVGHMRESYGFALYPDAAAFAAIARLSGGRDGEVPPMIMVDYATRADVGKARADEVRRHGWELAGPTAYPQALRVMSRASSRPLDAPELAALAAVMDTLADLIERTPDLARRWDDLPAERAASADGAVVLVAPAPPRRIVAPAPSVAGLAERLSQPLVTARGELSDDRVADYLEALETAFASSPEARGVEPGWALVFAEAAATRLGKTLATLAPDDARQLLFGFFPQQVSAIDDDAPAIVDSVRALLAFAARELGGFRANRALDAVSDHDAAEVLADEMAEPDNFGPAKRLILDGIAAGFDMTTDAGLAAWLDESNRRARAGAPKRPAAPKKAKPAAKKPEPAKKKPTGSKPKLKPAASKAAVTKRPKRR
nr:hypothetical protein [Kofleriaceae bacterium]